MDKGVKNALVLVQITKQSNHYKTIPHKMILFRDMSTEYPDEELKENWSDSAMLVALRKNRAQSDVTQTLGQKVRFYVGYYTSPDNL